MDSLNRAAARRASLKQTRGVSRQAHTHSHTHTHISTHTEQQALLPEYPLDVQCCRGAVSKVCVSVAPKCFSCDEDKSCLMFMFRSRRTNLTKRLIRKRRHEAKCKADVEENSDNVLALLKKLQENQLEMLLTAVDGRGADQGNCVLVPREYDSEPHVLCCQSWRWPDVRQGNELRRLPMCRSACDTVYICCNPFHWSRLCQPETPPPPYSRTWNVDRIKPEDRAPSEMPLLTRDSCESLTTNGESCTTNPMEWCKLAYWEMGNRVGSLFPVEPAAVNVFGDVPYGHDGLSLETLAQYNCNASETVRRTRSKIGLGVTLSREGECVWVYNRSSYPIFVNSLCLADGSDCPQPTRVPADHCLCVYDPVRAAHQNYGWNFAHPHYGPIDPNSIRISFVKGWGQNYPRREITSCPCWIEILLAPCR